MSVAPALPSKLTGVQIGDYAYGAGFRGESLKIAIAVAMAESGGAIGAVGDIGLQDAKWGPSIGLWQIRSLKEQKGTGRERDELKLYDPTFNAQSAWKISGGGRNWQRWSTFTNGDYKQYLGVGAIQGTAVESRGGSAGAVGSYEGDIYYAVPRPSRLSVEPVDPKNPNNVIVLGSDLPNLIGDSWRSGSVDMSADEISQIKLECIDPNWDIWSAPWKTHGQKVDWDGWILELAEASFDDSSGVNFTTLTFWPRGISALKSTQGQVRQNLTPGQWIQAECNAVGLSVIIWEAEKPPRPTIGPDDSTEETIPGLTVQSQPKEPESSWSTMKRLANEDGCILFALPEGTVVYGKPTIIARAFSFFDVGFRGSADGNADLDFSHISGELTADASSWIAVNTIATVYLPRWRGERVRPGMSIRLGLPGFEWGEAREDPHYIVKQVSWSLQNKHDDVELRIEKAVNPVGSGVKQDATSLGEPNLGMIGQSAGGFSKGTKMAKDFIAFALAQKGDAYVYGATSTGENPSAFDCSSLVQWAAAQVGISLPRTSDAQLNACKPITVEEASRIRGALIGIRGSGPNGHVVISLGDGRTIEARGKKYGVVEGSVANRGFNAAGLIPNMDYGFRRDAETTGFTGPVHSSHLVQSW